MNLLTLDYQLLLMPGTVQAEELKFTDFRKLAFHDFNEHLIKNPKLRIILGSGSNLKIPKNAFLRILAIGIFGISEIYPVSGFLITFFNFGIFIPGILKSSSILLLNRDFRRIGFPDKKPPLVMRLTLSILKSYIQEYLNFLKNCTRHDFFGIEEQSSSCLQRG